MTWTAVAIGGAGLAGSLIGAGASSSAASQQAGAATNATNAQLGMFNTVMGNLQPYQGAGGGALNALEFGLGISPTTPTSFLNSPMGSVPSPVGAGAPVPSNPAGVSPGSFDFNPNLAPAGFGPGSSAAPNTTGQATLSPTSGAFRTLTGNAPPVSSAMAGNVNNGTPGNFGWLTHPFGAADLNANLAPNYQFQLNQGLGQIGNENAAAGGAIGGNALTSLNSFAENYASNAYQNAYQNYRTNQSDIFGRLLGTSQLGEQASTGSASGAPLFSSGISQTLQGVGAANAAGTVGVANALNGGINNAAGYYMLNNIMNNGGGSGGGSSGFTGWI